MADTYLVVNGAAPGAAAAVAATTGIEMAYVRQASAGASGNKSSTTSNDFRGAKMIALKAASGGAAAALLPVSAQSGFLATFDGRPVAPVCQLGILVNGLPRRVTVDCAPFGVR